MMTDVCMLLLQGFPVVRYPSTFDRTALVGWLNYQLGQH